MKRAPKRPSSDRGPRQNHRGQRTLPVKSSSNVTLTGIAAKPNSGKAGSNPREPSRRMTDIADVRALAAARRLNARSSTKPRSAQPKSSLAGSTRSRSCVSLKLIQQRPNRPPRPVAGPPNPHPAKSQAKQPRWPKRAWRKVPTAAERQNASEVTCDGSQRLAPQRPSF